MSDSPKNVRVSIEQARERIAVLEEIDLLNTEFRLIQHEYAQRSKALEKRLADIDAEIQKG